ncbi:MAG: hypothetical protein OHK0046_16630 [Anaerolineae bacterium]
MQYVYEPTVHTHARIKPQADITKDVVESWWELIAPHCDRFFEQSSYFELSAPRNELTQALIDLENICSVVEKSAYPPQVTELRIKLLAAMSNVLVSFTAAVRGDNQSATIHAQKAERQLAQFSADLDALGIL